MSVRQIEIYNNFDNCENILYNKSSFAFLPGINPWTLEN